MGVCQTLLPFLTNPSTYLGLGGTGLFLAALYSYSSYTFLPGLLLFSRLSSGLNFVYNLLMRAVDMGLLKFVAVYTTFQATIQGLTGNGFSLGTFKLLAKEFLQKVSLSFKNIVEGLSLFTDWITKLNEGLCGLSQNSDLLLAGLASVWTGVAAYIFVVWVWDLMFYDWRNESMEQQTMVILVVAVTSLSLAVYGVDVLSQGVSNGVELMDSLENLTQSSSDLNISANSTVK